MLYGYVIAYKLKLKDLKTMNEIRNRERLSNLLTRFQNSLPKLASELEPLKSIDEKSTEHPYRCIKKIEKKLLISVLMMKIEISKLLA